MTPIQINFPIIYYYHDLKGLSSKHKGAYLLRWPVEELLHIADVQVYCAADTKAFMLPVSSLTFSTGWCLQFMTKEKRTNSLLNVSNELNSLSAAGTLVLQGISEDSSSQHIETTVRKNLKGFGVYLPCIINGRSLLKRCFQVCWSLPDSVSIAPAGVRERFLKQRFY